MVGAPESTTGALVSTPGWETKISHATPYSQKKKERNQPSGYTSHISSVNSHAGPGQSCWALLLLEGALDAGEIPARPPGEGPGRVLLLQGAVQSKPGLHGPLSWASTASPDPGVSELEKTLLILAELGTPEMPQVPT